MIRILHLLSTDADLQTRRCVEHLSSALGGGFATRVQHIGPGGDHSGTVAAVLRLRGHAKDFDLVHAWGMSALSVTAFCPFRSIAFTPAAFPARRHIRWLRAVMGQRDVQVLCPTSTIRKTLVERGIALERCHLIRPGVDFARIKRRRDPALRAGLGLDDSHHALLAVGETTRAAGHEQAAWAASIVNCLDHRTRLLMWGEGALTRRVMEFGDRLGFRGLAINARARLGEQVDFEQLLAATDMILVTATAAVPTLPISIAMAAGLPIVATVTPTVAELLEDRHTAVMTQPNLPRLVSEKILSLREDPQLQWSISDMARTEAFEFFSLTRFLDQHRTAYRQASAGQKVDIPEPAPGAGLRFHGRG